MRARCTFVVHIQNLGFSTTTAAESDSINALDGTDTIKVVIDWWESRGHFQRASLNLGMFCCHPVSVSACK